MQSPELDDARAQLDACERLVERLHRMCCEPDRSPRMEAILKNLVAVRARLDTLDDTDDAAYVIAQLENIGGQVGHLQVACCTETRMPLYADTLSGLAATQIHITHSVGQGSLTLRARLACQPGIPAPF